MSKGRAAGRATRARREEAAAPKIPAGGATWGRVAALRSPRTVTYARIQRAHGGTHPNLCMLGEMHPRTHKRGPMCTESPTLEYTQIRAHMPTTHRYQGHLPPDKRPER